MSYHIREDEVLGESIRRVASEQIDAAIAVSGVAHDGNSSPVHETRKHLKKARAALQLLAAEVGVIVSNARIVTCAMSPA